MAKATPYLEVIGLTKRIGERVLFHDITFTVNERERIGLIAQNGTGKSTLLSIIAGEQSYESGEIIFRNDLKLGYLPQTPSYAAHLTVGDVCLGHENELKTKQILTQLNITDMQATIGTLSGGQVKRVALARVLESEPDLIILDEPTNHLDIEMIEWLETYLSRTSASLLMVTHDRYFLDRVCNSIIEIDDSIIYSYAGNYSYYLQKRQERIDQRNAEIARANNLYRTELEWMRRMPQARGHKARYREEAFYELEKVAKQRTNDQKVKLETNARYIGSKIFEAHHVSKAFGERVILKDFNYTFSRYEKMGVVGHNGTGKSTFIKLLLGLIPTDHGQFDVGETVRFGHYSQEGMTFDEGAKVIDVIRDIAEYVEMGNGQRLSAGQFLQQFLFTPDKQYTHVAKLSGGERRRLYLCTVLMRSPNFLILDEPTNDLDIVTLQVLEEYLKEFRGCLIVVSHDRYFMDKIVDHLLVFKGQGYIQDFPGNYTQYRAWQREQSKQEVLGNTAMLKPTEPNVRQQNERQRKLSYKEKLEFERLEKEIAQLEQEKIEIEQALSGGQLSVESITELSIRLPQLNDELDEKSMRWLELSEIEG
jgi:ATP-binding cassette subfamily F protein uup